MLNNSGESGHPCLVPDRRGKALSFFPGPESISQALHLCLEILAYPHPYLRPLLAPKR